MKLHVASGSGNRFAYIFDQEGITSEDGSRWARSLRINSRQFDGFFILSPYIPGQPWVMKHWDTDGSETFCSNGTRAAMALIETPFSETITCYSNEEQVFLMKDSDGVSLKFPQDQRMGLVDLSIDLPYPYRFGYIGNPQLVILMKDISTFNLENWARALRYNKIFSEGSNINIVQINRLGEASIRSYERGVERETSCCGTGCAVAGAWLSEMTQCISWEFQTAHDPVRITMSSVRNGHWDNLWLSGPIQVEEPIDVELH